MKTRPHTVVTRKYGAKLPLEWTEEDDALLAGPRFTSDNNALATTANTLHVRALQEIFPSLERAVLQEVLVAARFQVDVAAAMLGELVRESIVLVDASEAAIQQDQPLDFDMIDADDDEDWSEVSAVVHNTRPLQDSQSWVMLHDEWEVVGMDGERVQTFAEILRHAGTNDPLLPALRVVTSPVTSRAAKQKPMAKDSAPVYAFNGAEQSVKSFGARKRRYLKARA